MAKAEDGKGGKGKGGRPGVNGVFLKRLIRLLKICVPRVVSMEAFYLVLVAAMMAARTYCDVWQISNGTAIERAIITADHASFIHHVIRFVSAMLPISAVNNVLKHGLRELSLRFRTRLSQHCFKEYLRGFTYYKMSNLDNRIANADQLLTQDVDKFCQSLSDLYSNIAKPLLDIVIFGAQLTGAIGGQGPIRMLTYLVFSGVVLTRLRRPVSRYTVQEQQLEGEFRFVNSRLITNSEEVAFYGGNDREKLVVDTTFKRLVTHLRKTSEFRLVTGIVDTIVAKYWATVVGYYTVSRPFFDPEKKRHKNMTQSEVMEDYYRSGRMLVSMASAVGRLVLAGRELTRLAGFTARMDELLVVLKDLNEGRYERTMVNEDTGGKGGDKKASSLALKPNAGQIVTQDRLIRFEDVPLVTPNGDVLVEKLSFEVKQGMNVLVCGPNGCGKSSLFRTLGELWPLFGGKMTKPDMKKCFYVPQRPYMTLGPLRDQIIYPDLKEDARTRGFTDDKLMSILKDVHLEYLVDREGGWDSVQDWMDVCSGGEKQRLAMARLFYHTPQYAILDECTSAVSVDVEGFMYNRCRELGISLFTVSHRKSLWKYHEYVLAFDGRGKYNFDLIDQKNTGDQFGS